MFETKAEVAVNVVDDRIEAAAAIAVATVRAVPPALDGVREVTFCCFTAADLAVYQKVLDGTGTV